MKIQNPNLRPEELDRALDYDKALAHFFKVRGLSRDSQEAFTITVGNCVSRFAGVREAFALLDQEQDTNVPRYLSEAPVNVQARVILLNLPTVPHEGDASELMMYQDLVPGLAAAVLMIKNEGEREKDNGNEEA